MLAFHNENYQKEYLMDCGKRQKRLPRGFEEFVNSDLCAEFAESIFEYCVYLIKVEDKKQRLE